MDLSKTDESSSSLKSLSFIIEFQQLYTILPLRFHWKTIPPMDKIDKHPASEKEREFEQKNIF